MNETPQFDFQRTQLLAEPGDLNAITAWLNHQLNPRGITVRVGWKNHCLGILLESSPFPDQTEMVSLIRQSLTRFNSELLKLVKVCGYQPGQSVPAWYEEIELENLEQATPELNYCAPSLLNWLNQGLDAASAAEAPLKSTGPANEPQRFLRFAINTDQMALLPLICIQAAIKIPVPEVLPVPHMPDCVVGLYNWRGEMLWLVDVAQQLGFTSAVAPSPAQADISTLVVQSDRQSIGLVVSRWLDVESHYPQQLQTPVTGLFPAKLMPFMQGYFVPSTSPVLNAKALIHDPLLQVHSSHSFTR